MGINGNPAPKLEEPAPRRQLRAEIRKGLDSGPSLRWDVKATKRKVRARRSSKGAS